MENYYEILGVSQTATDDQIKKAYLKQIKIYHPDVYEGDKTFAEEKTRQITEAYTVLKGYLTRKGYDEKLKKQTKTNNSSDKEQSTEQTTNSEAKKNEEKNNESNNKNFNEETREDIKKDNKKHKNTNKKEKDNQQEKQKETQSEDINIKNKNLEAHIEPLSKSELKDKKILNIIIITLIFLLILSIIMTFITIN